MKLGTLLVTTALVGGALTGNAAPASRISHEPLRCVPAGANAKVSASWAGAGQVTMARVYFRAAGAKEESFLELRRTAAPNGYWAVLPVPAPGVTSIAYRVVLKDADGRAPSTDPAEVPVLSSCPVALTTDEVAYARNLVVGQTSLAQGAVPSGFSCAGVVAAIATNGDMRSVPPCSEAVAAGRMAAAPAEKPASRSVTPMRLDSPPLVIGGQAPVSGTIPTPAPTQPPISPARPN